MQEVAMSNDDDSDSHVNCLPCLVVVAALATISISLFRAVGSRTQEYQPCLDAMERIQEFPLSSEIASKIESSLRCLDKSKRFSSSKSFTTLKRASDYLKTSSNKVIEVQMAKTVEESTSNLQQEVGDYIFAPINSLLTSLMVILGIILAICALDLTIAHLIDE